MTDKDREQGQPFPALFRETPRIAARKAAETAKEKGLTGVQDLCTNIQVRARGSQYSKAVKLLRYRPEWGLNNQRLNPLSGPWLEHTSVEFTGLRIGTIEDVTPDELSSGDLHTAS